MREILADEELVKRVERMNAILLVVLTLGGGILFSFRAALGVLMGGAISIVSFRVLKWQLRRAFLGGGGPPSRGGLLAAYYLRFLGVVFVIFTIVYYGWVHPIALLVGLSVVVISILGVGVQEFLLMLLKGGR